MEIGRVPLDTSRHDTKSISPDVLVKRLNQQLRRSHFGSTCRIISSAKLQVLHRTNQDKTNKGETTSSPSKKPAAGELKTFWGLMLGIYQIGVSSTCTYSSIPGWPTGGNAGWLIGRTSMLKRKEKGKPAKEDPRRRPSNHPT